MFDIVKSYENRKKISILTQTVSYFCFSFSANSQIIILIYNSRKFSLSKNSYSPRLSLETPPSELKVTSKNISPKAKKYGIIEPTNKVGDLDAVESICRR